MGFSVLILVGFFRVGEGKRRLVVGLVVVFVELLGFK